MSNGMRVQIPPPALSPRHFKMQIAEYRLQIERAARALLVCYLTASGKRQAEGGEN